MKEKRFFLTSLKQTCNEYLTKFSENQSAPKLENRKTSLCSPCAPNLLHVLVSRIPGYHNLCSPGGRSLARPRLVFWGVYLYFDFLDLYLYLSQFIAEPSGRSRTGPPLLRGVYLYLILFVFVHLFFIFSISILFSLVVLSQ